MTQYLAFALIGLGVGSFYAALATGLVVTYRGTGVINFAAGAMATWGVYVYDELRRHGDLVLPVIGVPNRIELGSSVAFVPSFALGIVSTTMIGLLAHVAVFRPLRNAPVLAKVVGTVGVMLISQAMIVRSFGAEPRQVANLLTNEPVVVGDLNVPRDRLFIAAVSVGLAVLLWAYFRFTRFGLATLAGTENERAIASAGFSPQLLAGITWALASTATGVTLILASPFTVLNPLSFTLAIVPALAAVMLARLNSVGIAVAGGLGIGSLHAMLTFSTTKAWWPDFARNGVREAVQFVILAGTLYLLGKRLPERGSAQVDPLPEVFRPSNRPTVVSIMALVGVAAVVFTDGSFRFGVMTTMIMAIIALSLVVLTGLVGQISLAQAAFAGASGFTLSKLIEHTDIPFPLTPVIAALVAAVLGVVVGLPALRIRGAHLAVVTLGLAVAVERFIFRNPVLTPSNGNVISGPELFGIDLTVREGRNIARIEFGLLVVVIAVLVFVAVGNIARGSTGRRFLAVRSDEKAAAGVGVDVAATKLTAFALSSFLAGVGGVLLGYSRGQLSADSFGVFVGLSILTFAYLGGITSVSGAVVAGTFAPLGIGFVLFDRLIGAADQYLLLSGVGLVITAIFNPVGIAGANRQLLDRLSPSRSDRLADLAGQAEAPLPSRDVADGEDGRAEIQHHRRVFPGSEVVLSARTIDVSYSGIKAVDSVTIDVRSGQVVGLIGANGAGKTTMLDAIGGFVDHGGEVELNGVIIDGLAPHQRAEAGMARTWQSIQLFRDLTVGENVRIAAEPKRAVSTLVDVVRPSMSAIDARVETTLELMGLSAVADRAPGQLSLGRQKLVGLARAMVSDPTVVLLDEPAAGLDETARKRIARRVIDIVNDGAAVLVIDHDMNFVFDVCDHIYVLDFGRLIASGPPQAVRGDQAVMDAYLGVV